MIDIPSLESIEDQLHQNPFKTSIEKGQYIHNLKSECLFKENALRTAQNLIEEYYHQNEELKLEVLRLNQKIQHYQEMIQVLKQQVENRDFLNAKNYRKQLFKSSIKLSKVLEKYSELQQKYYLIEKQLIKEKNSTKHIKSQKQQTLKQHQMKQQIEKQFENYLRTPVNKPDHSYTNASTSKKTFFKAQNRKSLRINNFQSQSDDNDKTRQLLQSSSDQSKGFDLQNFSSFLKNRSIRKSQEKTNKIYERQFQKKQTIKPKRNQQEEALLQKLRILEWKIKEKDEEIMLMLRRNKQIESKYSLLKQILTKNSKQPGQKNIFQTFNTDKYQNRKNLSNERKDEEQKNNSNRRQKSKQGNQIEDFENEIGSKLSNIKGVSLEASLNHSTDNSTWKNCQNFRYE